MGTSCFAIVKCRDNKVRSMYISHDGYLGGVGKKLYEDFNTQKGAEDVIAGKGNIYGQHDYEVEIDDSMDQALKDTDGYEYRYIWENECWSAVFDNMIVKMPVTDDDWFTHGE